MSADDLRTPGCGYYSCEERARTDDLRTRAREAAEAEYPESGFEPQYPGAWKDTEADREAYVRGYLAHAAQQPTRDIDVDELARVITDAGGRSPDYIACVIYDYLTGDESNE